MFICLILYALGFSIWLLMSAGLSARFPDSDAGSSVALTLLLNWAWLPAVIIGALLNAIRAPLFPVATFAIGYGVKRHEQTQTIRNIVFVVFGVGVFASVVATWLTDLW